MNYIGNIIKILIRLMYFLINLIIIKDRRLTNSVVILATD